MNASLSLVHETSLSSDSVMPAWVMSPRACARVPMPNTEDLTCCSAAKQLMQLDPLARPTG